MANDTSELDRRTVLRTVGGSLVGVTAGTGLASATLETNDCARTGTNTPVYQYACPLEGHLGDHPPGVEGFIMRACTDENNYNYRYVYFIPDHGSSSVGSGWVYEGNLAEITC